MMETVKRRWAWNIFCAFSLLIFATSVTLWVRSYFVNEKLTRICWLEDPVNAQPAYTMVACGAHWSGGSMALFIKKVQKLGMLRQDTFWCLGREGRVKSLIEVDWPLDQINLRFAGFQLKYSIMDARQGRFSDGQVVLPLWLFLIFGVPPLLWWRKRRNKRGRGFPVEASAAIRTAPKVRGDAKITK